MQQRYILGLIAAVCSAILIPAASASALSCAPHPDSSPRSIILGEEQLAGGERFFSKYHFGFIGSVEKITTDEDAGSDEYGATEVLFGVEAAFGISEVNAQLLAFQPDPGWFAGYPFVAGATYFVPATALPGVGLIDIAVCAPVTRIEAQHAQELIALAGTADLATAFPDAASSEPPRKSSVSDDPRIGPSVTQLGLAAIGTLLAVGWLAARWTSVRRARRNHHR